MAATEVKALCDHRVDLSLPILLTNALVGGQPRQSLTQVVVIRLPDDEQPSRKLRSNSSLVRYSMMFIMGYADQRVSAVVMRRVICVVLCPVESTAEKSFSVAHHHHQQDHQTKTYTAH